MFYLLKLPENGRTYQNKVNVYPEGVVPMSSVKKVFLKISPNSLKKACVNVSFLIKIKETLAQVFSCKFDKIIKNTFFIKHLRWLLLFLVNLRKKQIKNQLIF